MSRLGKIVILGMFDLTQLNSARAVRIRNLYTALQALTPVTLISGSRRVRHRAVLRFLLQGGLRRTRAVYVEASTSTANPLDLLLLILARVRRIPIVVYIPDAYQDFPTVFQRRGLKIKLLDWAWRRTIAIYLRVANLLLFPSPGLSACFHYQQQSDLLPPAGLPNQPCSALSWQPPTIIYIGGASPRYGSDLLLSAMEQVVARYPTARCHFVTRNDEAIVNHSARHAPWLTVESRKFDELPAVMAAATVAVIPLRINSYNDLAVPVKLFDYMAFGRPLVTTGCRDTAALVNELKAGLVVDDTVDALTQGIIRLLEDPDLANRLGQNGYRAIQTAHSWSHRAARLLQIVETLH
jgi:glycosyltransferase involved in cell wall biosynthesis